MSPCDDVAPSTAPDPGRRRWPASRALGATAAAGASLVVLALLTLAVSIGATQVVDDRVFQLFRPGDEWASGQLAMDVVVTVLNPMVVLGVALALGLLTAWRRESWRPLAMAAGTVAAVVVLVGVMQPAIGRLDAHGDYLGGSFPSGHTAAFATAAGVLVILHGRWATLPRTLLTGFLASAVIGFALLVQGSHWGSDVVGASLLATVILACVWWLSGPAGRPGTTQA